MFNFAVSRESLLSGFQWFFFIFATRLWFLLRYFLLFSCRKVACLHSRNMLFLLPRWPASLRRSAVIVALLWKGRVACGGNHPYYHPWRSIARDTDQRYRHQPGGGIALSGVLTMLIGFSGLGHRLARLFTPSVMVLFMLMLGAQLTTIFSKVCWGCRLA